MIRGHILEWSLWLLLFVGIYPYLGYPILVSFLGRLLRRSVRTNDSYRPRVTIVTAAYNEAAHIEATVRNKLDQDYPPELLDVIVVSDESDDGTDEIVAGIAAQHPNVRLMRQAPRRGKTAALNLALPAVRGEVIVFADANSIYRRDTVRKLVRNFADPTVGYVTGRMVYVNPDGSLVGDGCSAFMRYENALRKAETRVGSIVGVDGGVDAVRTHLYEPMRSEQLPDFVLPLTVIERGFRVVFEPDAMLTENTLTTGASEYRMRVRVALRALWALWDKRGLLNPLRYPLFSLQLVSHKLLRYMSFLPLFLAFLVSWPLALHSWPYRMILAVQILFGTLALFAWRAPRTVGAWAPARYSYYFLLLNWASAVAFGKFLRGQQQVLWQPRSG